MPFDTSNSLHPTPKPGRQAGGIRKPLRPPKTSKLFEEPWENTGPLDQIEDYERQRELLNITTRFSSPPPDSSSPSISAHGNWMSGLSTTEEYSAGPRLDLQEDLRRAKERILEGAVQEAPDAEEALRAAGLGDFQKFAMAETTEKENSVPAATRVAHRMAAATSSAGSRSAAGSGNRAAGGPPSRPPPGSGSTGGNGGGIGRGGNGRPRRTVLGSASEDGGEGTDSAKDPSRAPAGAPAPASTQTIGTRDRAADPPPASPPAKAVRRPRKAAANPVDPASAEAHPAVAALSIPAGEAQLPPDARRKRAAKAVDLTAPAAVGDGSDGGVGSQSEPQAKRKRTAGKGKAAAAAGPPDVAIPPLQGAAESVAAPVTAPTALEIQPVATARRKRAPKTVETTAAVSAASANQDSDIGGGSSQSEPQAKRKRAAAKPKPAAAAGRDDGAANEDAKAGAEDALLDYDPVAAATWRAGEPVPFAFLAAALERLQATTKRCRGPHIRRTLGLPTPPLAVENSGLVM